MTIKEPTVPVKKAKVFAPNKDKAKSVMIEEPEMDSSDEEMVLAQIPLECWPEDKLEAFDKDFAAKEQEKDYLAEQK